jgi:PPM family protein phosphatase
MSLLRSVNDSSGLRWGAATSAGRVRTDNEDNHVAESSVFVVADGMGGHNAGEVASQMAVDTMRDRLGHGAANLGVVVAAVVEANAAIFQGAYSNAAQRGMGTTLTGVVILPANDRHPDRLGVVNVGDSRTYVRRTGTLHRATIDHSYVQELVSTGHITEHDARSHPRRNIVTRALGIEPTVKVDSWLVPLVQGDRWLMCSDGLVDEVLDPVIDELLATNSDPQAAADALVAAALANGGRDNVTVIVLDIVEGVSADQADHIELDPWDEDLPTMIDADSDGDFSSGLGDGLADIDESPGARQSGRLRVDITAPIPLASGGYVAAGGTTPGGIGTGITAQGSAAASTGANAGSNVDTSGRAARKATKAAKAQQQAVEAARGGRTATATGTHPRRRRFSGGTFIFLLALAAIATVTIAFVTASIGNRNDRKPPATSTTTTPDTSSSTSTSTSTTTTTPSSSTSSDPALGG